MRWSRNPNLRTWIAGCRLDAYAKLFAALKPGDPEIADLQRFRGQVGPALENLQRLSAS